VVLQKDLGESSFQGSRHLPPLVSVEKFASEISSLLLLGEIKVTNLSCISCTDKSQSYKQLATNKNRAKGVFIFRDGLTLTFMQVIFKLVVVPYITEDSKRSQSVFPD
jgi:hypothetical protein